jgi:osmoprotectant transport system substrate-binding protein
MKRTTVGRLLVLLTSLVLLLAACGGGDDAGGGDETAGAGTSEPATEAESEVERGEVTIGSTDFTEQQIVGEMYALVLEEAGYTVDRRYQLGSREVVFPALQSGELDITAEYIGTLLEFINGGAGQATSDMEETLGLLEDQLDENLTVLEPSAAQDSNALAVTQETANQLNLSKVSDLEGHTDLVLGGPPECPQRPLCLPGYEETYGLQFANFRPLDAGGPLTTEALNNGDIDVGLVFSTLGVIAANDWVVLEDDKGLQPAENIIPAVRKDVLNGEIEELLNGVSAVLTTENVTELNRLADVEGQAPEDVAREFLETEGLLGGGAGAGASEPATGASEPATGASGPSEAAS